MQTRYVANEFSREQLVLYIQQHKLPFMVEIHSASARSVEQNRLQFLWINEIAMQTGATPSDVRARLKLTIGVPLLREESEKFRKAYDGMLKPLTYEEKLTLIRDLDLPITRAMTQKQFGTYLDRVFEQHAAKGYELTQPEIAEWR